MYVRTFPVFISYNRQLEKQSHIMISWHLSYQLPVARKRRVTASLTPGGIARRNDVSFLCMKGVTFSNKLLKISGDKRIKFRNPCPSSLCSSPMSCSYAPFSGLLSNHGSYPPPILPALCKPPPDNSVCNIEAA